MIKKSILALILSFSSFSTFAEWIEFDKDNEKTFYSDPSRWSIKSEDTKKIEVWMKNVIHTDLTKDGLSVGDYQLTKHSVSCENKEIALLAYYAYSKGKVIDSYIENYPSYTPLIPDSRGEYLANTACVMLFNPPQEA